MGQYAQNSQSHAYSVQYPQMVQYPYLPQDYASTGILSLPSSMPILPTNSSSGDPSHSSNCLPYGMFSIVFKAVVLLSHCHKLLT